MSKYTVETKSIKRFLTDNQSEFLIPDYQRPYAWTEDECSTLWDDLFSFAFPGDNRDNFSNDEEYFLGPIVTFKNSEAKLEVIDGQQRLTTIMLLLRAFYDKFSNMQDGDAIKMREMIASCVWQTDDFENPMKDFLKIDSDVASDDDKEEFLQILRTGVVETSWRSNYAKNFKYFQGRIDYLVNKWPSYTSYMPARVLNYVSILMIEAESQETALRIFSTLNDRGLPLSDADIFKSQFYRYYSDLGRKDEFVDRWKSLEVTANDLFHPRRGTPVDELFSRYMYYRRAKEGEADTTTKGLRDFFSENKYSIFKQDATLKDLERLLAFWDKVDNQSNEFSENVLKKLFVLNYAPNGMWSNLVSVWFLANANEDGAIVNSEFCDFLDKITAFIFAYAINRPGVNALRGPVYPELVKIVEHRPVDFENYRFDRDELIANLHTYRFTNQRPITKSLLTWWAFSNKEQPLLPLDEKLEIEHIYATKRNELQPLENQNNLEALGNKSVLEKKINIRAADYRFKDKCMFYEGFIDSGGTEKKGTQILDLRNLAQENSDFVEPDIEARTEQIISAFIDYLGENGLLK